MKAIPKVRTNAQSGFTVIELMIATSIFTVVLLLLTFGLMQIGKVYYKGTVSVRTQNTARSISDEVVDAIKYGGGSVTPIPQQAPSPSGNSICIGNKLFVYVLNRQFNDAHPDQHAFVSHRSTGMCSLGTGLLTGLIQDTTDDAELIPSGMRLANFEIISIPGSSNLYSVKVRVIFGDNDLIVDNSNVDANGKKPDGTNSATPFKTDEAHCKGSAGQQFCAVSELFTRVTKRI